MELKNLEGKDFPFEKYIQNKECSRIVDKTRYWNSGWYAIYSHHCSKLCHYNCKGPNEGLDSNEYVCNMVGILSRDYSDCSSHWDSHSLRISFTEKV